MTDSSGSRRSSASASVSSGAAGSGSGSGGSTSESTLSTRLTTDVGAIVGGVIGGIAGLVAILALLWFFCIKRKRRDKQAAFDDKMFDPSRSARHSTGDPLDLLQPSFPQTEGTRVDPYPYQAPMPMEDQYNLAPSMQNHGYGQSQYPAYGAGGGDPYAAAAAGMGLAGIGAGGGYAAHQAHHDPYAGSSTMSHSPPPSTAAQSKQREAQSERMRHGEGSYYGHGQSSYGGPMSESDYGPDASQSHQNWASPEPSEAGAPNNNNRTSVASASEVIQHTDGGEIPPKYVFTHCNVTTAHN